MTAHDYADDLLPCESEIAPASNALLLRQVGRQTWDDVNGVPTAPAFGPANSARRPSFAHGVDAQEARDWHQKHARSASLGVWAVTTNEVAHTGLRVVDDSDCPDPDGTRSPGHCYVDYRGLSRSKKNEIQGYLVMKAVAREEIPTVDIGHHSLADSGDSG